MLKYFSLLFVIVVALLCVQCSPSLLSLATTTAVAAPSIAKSEAAKKKAQTLKRDSTSVTTDSIEYATYYVYRNGSFVGSLLSCLVYDNNQYVALAEVNTFEKVDNVIPGDHVFTSEVDSKDAVKIHFDPGKTYIIQVLAGTAIKQGVVFMIDQSKIKKQLSKDSFLKRYFLSHKLKVEDFSYNDIFVLKK